MFIFPLVHPRIMHFGVFPFFHPLAVKVPIFFVSPPAVYMTLGDWILLLRLFFAVPRWLLSAQLLQCFSLSNIFSSLPFKRAKSCPLCPLCCCRTKGCRTGHSLSLNTQLEVFSSLSSQIHPIPSYYHFTLLNKAKYPLSVQTMKSFIPVSIFLP